MQSCGQLLGQALESDMSDHETDRIYERAGFGATVRRGGRPAIVVVDFSRGFTEPQFPTGSDLAAEVAATARLLAAARERRAPIVFTTIAYEPHLRDGGAWLEKAPGLAILQAGSELVEIDPRLDPRPEETVVVKKGASAFFGTNLAAILAVQRVDTVVLCGATTSGCIRASAVDSVQSGFPTLVVRECVGDRAQGPHDANLFDIQAKYADVIALDDALGYVAGLPVSEDVPA
jgi:N-formylmaleamate deformylase